MLVSPLFAICVLQVTSGLATPCRPRTDGCGIPHDVGFNNNTATHQVSSGGRTRTYGITVPSQYNNDSNKRWPLIVDYHGNRGTGWSQYDNSRYYANQQGAEYLVVYPNGVGESWQGPSYAVEGVDDLQFTSDLLVRIASAKALQCAKTLPGSFEKHILH